MAALHLDTTHYNTYFKQANPKLCDGLCENYNQLLHQRLQALASVSFDTKHRFIFDDPFSFAKVDGQITVLLSRKSFPNDFHSLKAKFRFAFHADASNPLMIQRREIVGVNYKASQPPADILQSKEIRILKECQDIPGVIGFFGAYSYVKKENLKRFTLLEHCAGGNLHSYINDFINRREYIPHATQLIEEVLNIVGMLHARHVFHRDIKAENFVLTADGQLRIIDFEFSVYSNEPADGKGPGTLKCIPPEYFHKIITPAGDVWATGVVVHNLYFCSEPAFSSTLRIENGRLAGVDDYYEKVNDYQEHDISNAVDAYPELFKKMFHPDYEERITMKEITAPVPCPEPSSAR